MLSVILGILKIIGILLGVLVLLLLLGICAVCFVPVRYRISLRKEEDVLEGAVRVSWMFRLFTFTIGYQEKQLVRSIRIFAVPLEKWTALIGRITNRKKTRTQKKKQKKTPQTGQAERAVRQQAPQPKLDLPGPQAEEQEQFRQPPPAEEKSGTGSAFDRIRLLPGRISGIIRSAIAFFTGLPARISGFFTGCKGKAKNLRHTLNRLLVQANYYVKLWQHEQTRAVTARMKGHLFYLFTHYRPRSIDGYLKLGFSDPATTGQAVGMIYLLMPVKKGRFSLEPDFHQPVLEGNLTIRGYIRGVHGIKTVLSLIFDKELKLTIKRIRRKGGPSDGR